MTQESGTNRKRKNIAAAFLVAAVLILLFFAVRYIRFRMKYAVTNAVFVRTDSLANIGFEHVGGKVVLVSKNEGDPVLKGEVIAKIDDKIYRFQVGKIKSSIKSAQNSLAAKKLMLKRLKAQLDLGVSAARCRVDELVKKKEAVLANARRIQIQIEQLEKDSNRYHALTKSRAVARHRLEDILTRLAAKKAEKESTEKKADALGKSIESARIDVRLSEVKQTRIAEIKKEIQALDEKIRSMEAELKAAEQKLTYCVLKSPMTGRIAKRYVATGDIVTPADPVYAVLNPEDLYVVALLEENKLKGVCSGNPVTISIDAYPDQTYKGVVDYVLPASAATFALAPRDISAGEFTKVAQRIPIRIRITEGDRKRLRVGLSGEVVIARRKS